MAKKSAKSKKAKPVNEFNSFAWGCSGSVKFGIFFIVLGLYFLAKDLGWIQIDISIWPLILIFLGISMLIPKRRC